MARLAGKTVLITGGANGIGYCTAMKFAEEGCQVIITDINKKALEKAAKDLKKTGASITTFVSDVSNRKQVQKLAQDIEEQFGGLDVLINNAGIGYNGELVETTYEDWERLININFWGPLNHVYSFLPLMIKQGGGQIVNVSSGQAFFRMPTWGAYATVKLALGGFSEILHFEVKKFNINVTTVYPYMVNTGFYNDMATDTFGARMTKKLLPYYSQTPETVGKIIFKAVKKKKRLEMVHVLNDVGFYSRFFPHISSAVSTVTNRFMSKDAKDCKISE
jgi:NAD(P)-dependent dehydrogenase (short-subunit alcohol dehydrogenase family)